MKISDIQDVLTLVRQMFVSGGGNKGATELADFSAALEPFRDLTPKQFVSQLAKLTEQPSGSASSSRSRRSGGVNAAELIQSVAELYENAGSRTTTREEIDAKLAAAASLKKAELVKMSEAIKLGGMNRKTVPVIIDEIRRRIYDRLGTGHRMDTVTVSFEASGDPVPFQTR
jgi:hypothetical protein